LRSDNGPLLTYAATNAVYPRFSDKGDFVTSAWKYLAKGGETRANVFLQTGYGETIVMRDVTSSGRGIKKQVFPAETAEAKRGSNIPGKLQYRLAPPTASETTSVFQQAGATYDESKHCIVLAADANDSTGPGDSGGPLFVAYYEASAYKLALIGLTLGADMATTKIPCPPSPAVRVNNVATSLEPFYSLDGPGLAALPWLV